MNLDITYYCSYEPHPWDAKHRDNGVRAWTLIRQVSERSTKHIISRTPVAMFAPDSEAETFQRFLIEGGKVIPADEVVELVQIQKRSRGL